MRHFKFFPKVFYPQVIEKNGVYSDLTEVANITLAARFREVLKNDALHFYPYIIHDEDRPDIVAHKYYGSPEYTWLIFYANDIIDPIYDWPLPYSDFVSYLQKKYGSVEITQNTIKNYYNKNGYIVDYDSWLELPVNERSLDTVWDWENTINERKRQIRILEDAYLSKVLSEFREIMKVVR